MKSLNSLVSVIILLQFISASSATERLSSEESEQTKCYKRDWKGDCTACDNGYWLQVGYCLKCDLSFDHCLECSSDGSRCERCEEPFELDGGECISTVICLTNEDFKFGTYIIDKPRRIYKLAEDIIFNPNSRETLTAAISDGTIPLETANELELSNPVDAYKSGMPLSTQFATGTIPEFTVGGPLDALYDPKAYGIGFFAAIVIIADDVVLDLAGYTLRQSPEHALLQRFFSLVELSDQPFGPTEGPHSFGSEVRSAYNPTIKNGILGLSSHHGIHGMVNFFVTIEDIRFVGYELAAVALNYVITLHVRNVIATNRKDVPVLATFSAARFIQPYVDHLVRTGSPTFLNVNGLFQSAGDIQTSLRDAINNVHHDIIVSPNIVEGRAQIDKTVHPEEYAVFHNKHGVLDANSFAFLVNKRGAAVNGFAQTTDIDLAMDANFEDVHVINQQAFIEEVVAVDIGGEPARDPVGAVFRLRNLHPDTDALLTITDNDDTVAEYIGTFLSNTQLLVAKAALNNEFTGSGLDITRLNIPLSLVQWAEREPGFENLAVIGVSYICNGDAMFHVDKGVFGFRMEGVLGVNLINTSVSGLHNLGTEGSSVCGDYIDAKSHPLATDTGYGGSKTRGYSFAGCFSVQVHDSSSDNLSAMAGSVMGFDVLTDTNGVTFNRATATNLNAGWAGPVNEGVTEGPLAIGFRVSEAAVGVEIWEGDAILLNGENGIHVLFDESGAAIIY